MSEHTPLTEAGWAGKRLREHLYKSTGGRGIADLDLVLDAARTSTATADTVPWGACTGASDCPERWHVHGCFADRGQCDDPTDHAATADTGLRERVEALADDPALIEVMRKGIEDALIEWRDERRSMICGNGFTVCEQDGSPSPIIRFRTDFGLRIGLRALADHLAAPTTDTGARDE